MAFSRPPAHLYSLLFALDDKERDAARKQHTAADHCGNNGFFDPYRAHWQTDDERLAVPVHHQIHDRAFCVIEILAVRLSGIILI